MSARPDFSTTALRIPAMPKMAGLIAIAFLEGRIEATENLIASFSNPVHALGLRQALADKKAIELAGWYQEHADACAAYEDRFGEIPRNGSSVDIRWRL